MYYARFYAPMDTPKWPKSSDPSKFTFWPQKRFFENLNFDFQNIVGKKSSLPHFSEKKSSSPLFPRINIFASLIFFSKIILRTPIDGPGQFTQ